MVNGLVGPRRPNRGKREPYECGLPSEVSRTFRFGVSFYMVAMLFILFDIEVVFLYPVGVILRAAHSVFVLAEVGVFVVLLLVALAYVWRRGARDGGGGARGCAPSRRSTSRRRPPTFASVSFAPATCCEEISRGRRSSSMS